MFWFQFIFVFSYCNKIIFTMLIFVIFLKNVILFINFITYLFVLFYLLLIHLFIYCPLYHFFVLSYLFSTTVTRCFFPASFFWYVLLSYFEILLLFCDFRRVALVSWVLCVFWTTITTLRPGLPAAPPPQGPSPRRAGGPLSRQDPLLRTTGLVDHRQPTPSEPTAAFTKRPRPKKRGEKGKIKNQCVNF